MEASLTVVSFDIFVQGFKGGVRSVVDRDLIVAALGSSLKRRAPTSTLKLPMAV